MGKKKHAERADVIQVLSLGMGDSPINPDDPSYTWRILAEGDSWFTIGAIPSSNLLYELRFSAPTVILNLGYPGDTISHVSELSVNRDLVQRLTSPQWASDWDAILLSGGGNDLIDRAAEILLETPKGAGKRATQYIDEEALQSLTADVQESYRRIVQLRDSDGTANNGKPIVVHTYDYPTPRNAPATFLVVPMTRPWLHPLFEKRGISPALRVKITDTLVDALARSIIELQHELAAFYVVDTRDTLKRAEYGALGNSGDWLNEIHPNTDGYRKIARKIERKLSSVLK